MSAVKQLRVGAFASYCALDDSGSVLCWRIQDGAWIPPAPVALDGARAIAMPHMDYPCAVPAAGNILCQSIVDDTRVELPDSANVVDIEAGSGGLVLCGADAKSAWQRWNVPSYLFASMAGADVAGLLPFVVATDAPVKELVIAGFRARMLRADNAVACVDDAADADSAAVLVQQMRLDVKRIIAGLPD